MAQYETRVRLPNGSEESRRVVADSPQAARALFEQLYGGPRAVPYLPRMVSN